MLPCSARREGRLQDTVKPKATYLHLLPELSFHPFYFPWEYVVAKLPGFLWGQASPYVRRYLCTATQRRQYPTPIKVNGNQQIQASLGLAGRAHRSALAKPCPILMQLNCCCAKLFRSCCVLLMQRCPPGWESMVAPSSWSRPCTSLLPPCRHPQRSCRCPTHHQ